MAKVLTGAPQALPNNLELAPSSARKAVERFNAGVNLALTSPDLYAAKDVPGSKIVLRAAFAGGDTILKRVTDSSRTTQERVVAALISPVALLSLGFGTMGLAFFTAGYHVTKSEYFDQRSYKLKKKTRNQIHAIHDQARELDKNLKPHFKDGRPNTRIFYDLPDISEQLNASMALLSTAQAHQLGVSRLQKIPRKYLTAADKPVVPPTAG